MDKTDSPGPQVSSFPPKWRSFLTTFWSHGAEGIYFNAANVA